MLKKLVSLTLATGALILAAPLAASASTPSTVDSYAKPPEVTIDQPVIETCGTSTIAFRTGYFLPDEDVSVEVAGTNAADATYSGEVADGAGALALSFRPPADGEGRYSVALSGSRSYTALITVKKADESTTCGLARTGGGVEPWMIGTGALALAAGGILVATSVRRRGTR